MASVQIPLPVAIKTEQEPSPTASEQELLPTESEQRM